MSECTPDFPDNMQTHYIASFLFFVLKELHSFCRQNNCSQNAHYFNCFSILFCVLCIVYDLYCVHIKASRENANVISNSLVYLFHKTVFLFPPLFISLILNLNFLYVWDSVMPILFIFKHQWFNLRSKPIFNVEK